MAGFGSKDKPLFSQLGEDQNAEFDPSQFFNNATLDGQSQFVGQRAAGPLGGASRLLNSAGASQGSNHFDTSNFPMLSAGSNRSNLGSLAHSQQSDDFTLLNEDFPALPGGKPRDMDSDAKISLGGLLGGSSVGGGGGAVGGGDMNVNKEAKYGLAGLLDVIKMTDRELNILALGSDLTTFGLNLNSAECLFSSFSSPFAEQPSSAEPPYSTPNCYLIRPPHLKVEHLSKFAQETLFYMFYAMPRDLVQALAAQELYRREWRYHGELKVWLKARSPQEIMQSQAGGAAGSSAPGAPGSQAAGAGGANASAQYWHFDLNTWRVELYNSPVRGNLAAGLLTEEDIRVRILPPGAPGSSAAAGGAGTGSGAVAGGMGGGVQTQLPMPPS